MSSAPSCTTSGQRSAGRKRRRHRREAGRQSSLRLFSGRIADRTRAYWTITICGYAVNIIAVPALAFAGNWWMAALLIAMERTGKSIRGPARTAAMAGVACWGNRHRSAGCDSAVRHRSSGFHE